MHCQTLVLGAGIVGVSTALQLQARGRQVVLIDRDEPGSGTSQGNAGLIQCSSVTPYAFPRAVALLAALRAGTAGGRDPGHPAADAALRQRT